MEQEKQVRETKMEKGHSGKETFETDHFPKGTPLKKNNSET